MRSIPMKIVIAVLVVQTSVLLLIAGRITGLENELTPVTPGEQANSPATNLPVMRSQVNLVEPDAYPNEERLRQIIREELRAELDRESAPDRKADPVIVASSVDPAEMEQKRELVAQQLEYHLTVGSISDIEMQQLQLDIARLDPAGRMEMLSKLSRAFNSGSLAGRL